MHLPLALRSGSEVAGPNAAQEAAVADWHREAEERKQRQFSMYMNRKRYAIPAAGFKPLPVAPAANEESLVSLPAATSKSDGHIATAVPPPSAGTFPCRAPSVNISSDRNCIRCPNTAPHPPHGAGSLELHKQQQLAPELRALMALSTEAHSGWMAKLEKAGRSHKTRSRSHMAPHTPRKARRAPLKGTTKVWCAWHSLQVKSIRIIGHGSSDCVLSLMRPAGSERQGTLEHCLDGGGPGPAVESVHARHRAGVHQGQGA